MVGAAAALLPIRPATLRACVERRAARKAEKEREAALRALEAGQASVRAAARRGRLSRPLVADEHGELEALLSQARAEGRAQLYETEALVVATALGIDVPRHVVVRDAEAARALDLSAFPGRRVVVKVVSPDLAHKTEVGGVAVCTRDAESLARRSPRWARAWTAPRCAASWSPSASPTTPRPAASCCWACAGAATSGRW